MDENLASKLCLLLGDCSNSAVQWKLLGQEKDGSLLLGWVEEVKSDISANSYSVVGQYDRQIDKLKVLHRFPKVLNLIQASVNQYCSILGCVIKEKYNGALNDCLVDGETRGETSVKILANSESDCFYQAQIIELKSKEPKIHIIEKNKHNQVRIQFLYKDRLSKALDKVLIFVHQEYIQLCTVLYDFSCDIPNIEELKKEILVKSFIWAQWDLASQVLYYIYHKKPLASLFLDADGSPKPISTSPTLTGLQFHDELPHETVLNIPLNLPMPINSGNCGVYEDDIIPLRIHDCSLDLIVVSDLKGIVCVCHHYLYRPIQPPQEFLDGALNDANSVHFAYSVTLLHQSCVIHCVIPGIPWSKAKLMRPTFALYGDHHMIIFVQDFFTHILEIGLHHQPCCHILCGPLSNVPSHISYLVPLININSLFNKSSTDTKSKYLGKSLDSNFFTGNVNILSIDLPTLDLVNLNVATNFLIDVFKTETAKEIRLGILHYFLSHKNDLETVNELINSIAEKPKVLDISNMMQEFLISGSHTMVQKNLLSDSIPLLSLIPVTTMEEFSSFQAKIRNFNVTLSHEKLWNASVMLLSPQQRIVPYRSDLWTRLWDLLSKRSDELPRFKPRHIAEKLLVSLACYQPEALSRCSTPMSPNGGFSVTTATLGELMGSRYNTSLPFIETENCTASKQEHIVSVNLRELSLHLLKYGTQNSMNHFKGSCTPLQVHTMSTKHVAAQLETSRLLCQMLCKAANVDARIELERGFPLIDQLDDVRRWLLFTLFERYRYATESIAFPVPQGFMSFFTYLGYRTLKYPMFLQYVRNSVFELQVDVAKIIMADIGSKKSSTNTKLELLSYLPRTRAKRLLNQWQHPISFMLRAREHAANILSGETSRHRIPQHSHHHSGLAVFPSTDRHSPLDTFLDLLTAKASLTEIDFGLLIEATVTSTEDFIQAK